jgi:hypothetical protein
MRRSPDHDPSNDFFKRHKKQMQPRAGKEKHQPFKADAIGNGNEEYTSYVENWFIRLKYDKSSTLLLPCLGYRHGCRRRLLAFVISRK